MAFSWAKVYNQKQEITLESYTERTNYIFLGNQKRARIATQDLSPPPHLNNREFKIPRQRRPRKRRSKSDFGFFQSLLRLLQLNYFVKCKRTLLEPNCKETYSSSERERLFSRRLVMSFIKREIRRRSRAVTAKKCTKKRDARAELLFCLFNLLLF